MLQYFSTCRQHDELQNLFNDLHTQLFMVFTLLLKKEKYVDVPRLFCEIINNYRLDVYFWNSVSTQSKNIHEQRPRPLIH